jgi:hypothetical protein
MATQMPMPEGEMPDSVGARYNEELRNRTAAEDEAAFLSSPVTQAGEDIMEDAGDRFPVVPGRERTLPVQVGSGVGSVLGLAPAAATGPAAPFVAGLMYGASAGESAAMDADQTIKQKIAAALSVGDTGMAAELERTRFQKQNIAAAVTAPIGAITEGTLGVGPALMGRIAGKKAAAGIGVRIAEKLVGRNVPAWAAKRAGGAVEGFGREMLQEGSEQGLSNAAANMVYDPDRNITDGMAEAMIAGGLTGKLVGGTFGVDLKAAQQLASTGAIPSLPLPSSTQQVLQTQPAAAEVAVEEEADVAESETQSEVDAAMKAAEEAAVKARAEVAAREAVTLKLTGDLAPEEGEAAPVQAKNAPVEQTTTVEAVPAAAPVLEPPPQNNVLTPAEQSEMDRLETIVDSDMASKAQVARLKALKAKAEAVAVAAPAPVAELAVPVPAAAEPAPVPKPVALAAENEIHEIPDLPTEAAELVAREAAPDVFKMHAEAHFGANAAGDVPTRKPIQAGELEMLNRIRARAEQQGWAWPDVLAKVRQQLGLTEDYFKPESREQTVIDALRSLQEKNAQRQKLTDEQNAKIDREKAGKRPPPAPAPVPAPAPAPAPAPEPEPVAPVEETADEAKARWARMAGRTMTLGNKEADGMLWRDTEPLWQVADSVAAKPKERKGKKFTVIVDGQVTSSDSKAKIEKILQSIASNSPVRVFRNFDKGVTFDFDNPGEVAKPAPAPVPAAASAPQPEPGPAPTPAAPALDWTALEAKASKQGLKVIVEADGETQAVSLKGKPAAIALKKQRGTVEALRALVDCLGKA